MKRLILVLALCSASNCFAQENQTLADALKANSVPLASIPRLNSKITSCATLNDEDEFVIAYYLANEKDKNELRFPLYVARLEKKTGQWQNIQRDRLTLAVPGGMDFRTVDCLGSILSIERYSRGYYLNLHLTPSAGCLVVLTSSFKVPHTYPGWTVASVGNDMIWQGNTVHFADVHPLKLWLYDPREVTSTQIYPQPEDPVRKRFEERLAKVIDQKQCMENNWACDPKRFTAEVGKVEVSKEATAFAFLVHFSPEGFLKLEDADRSRQWDDDDYVYFYRLRPFSWRVFSLYDLKPKFGSDSLQQLLTPEKLNRIFANESSNVQ